ncbi:MAG: putative aliphatic sulfonates-binding protein precursor [Smithella sp. PtaU1.Bin162]|nr:MAG: putative aliphatic sulfonates-binding protein precursor [Smithella sp. PtaU1.Bin162]
MKKIILSLTALFLLTTSAFADPVRVGYLQSDIHQLPFWVALEKGFFEKEGVPVTIAGVFKAGPELMSGFSAGVLDMGYVGAAPTITAVANKAADVVMLAQVNTEGSALVVGKDSPVKSIGDLAGKTVAIPGFSTVQDALFRKAVTAQGLSLDRQKTIVLKPPEMISALRSGQVDAFIAWEPFPAKAVSMDAGKYLLYSRDIWKDHPCCVLVAGREYLKKNEDQARKIVRAHMQAVAYIKKNPRESMAVAVKYTGMDEKTIQLAMDNVKYTHILSVAGIKEYTDFLRNLKYIKNEDPSFADRIMLPDFAGKSAK